MDVPWGELCEALLVVTKGMCCLFDRHEGRVLKRYVDHEETRLMLDDPRYAVLNPASSQIQYTWITDFTGTIEDQTLRQRILQSIKGPGAFRRFKDILAEHHQHRSRWFEFRDIKLQELVVAWVEGQGVVPSNPPPWKDQAEPAPTLATELEELLSAELDAGAAARVVQEIQKRFVLVRR